MHSMMTLNRLFVNNETDTQLNWISIILMLFLNCFTMTMIQTYAGGEVDNTYSFQLNGPLKDYDSFISYKRAVLNLYFQYLI